MPLTVEQFKERNPAYQDWPDDKLVRALYFKFYSNQMSFKDFTGKIQYKPDIPRKSTSLIAADIQRDAQGRQAQQEAEIPESLLPGGGFRPYDPGYKDVNEFRVLGALAGGLVAFPASGIAGYAKLLTSGPDEALKTIEQIQSLPMKLLETEADQQMAESIMWPIEKVAYASKWYGDKMLEAYPNDPNLAALTATAIEATAFLALPKLGAKMKANIRAGKVAEARKMVLDFHRERLAKIRGEPRHLKGLVEAEKRLGMPEQKPMPLLKPKKEQIKAPKPRSVEERLASGTTLSFMGTQGIYEAMARNLPYLKQKAKAVAAAAGDILDVEAPWKRIHAPETGFHLKNFFSMRDRWETYGVDYGRRNSKLFNFDKKVAPDVVLSAENPAYFKNLPAETRAIVRDASNNLQQFFRDAQKAYDSRGVKLDFKERITNELTKLIDDAIDAGNPAREIADLRKALAAAKQMEFVHIPSAMWFEGKLATDPAFGNKLRLLAPQKRKTLMIKDLIDRGIIDKADVHPSDIIASYSRRMGRDFGLLNIVDAAVKEKLAIPLTQKEKIIGKKGYRKKPPEGYLHAPPNAGILKDYYLKPVLHDLVYEMTKHYDSKMGAVRSIFSIAKMTAFYNPFFLPVYDMIQAAMIGSATSIKMPVYMAKAIKSVWKKTPDYYEALDNGLASKPFNNPLRSWKHMVESAKRSRGGQVFDRIKDPNVLRTIYGASWHIAWRLDETVRMMTYNYLKDKWKLPPREAAQLASRFHSDYASVPASLRRKLNVPFFTPTFKITMGKLYIDMVRGAIQTATGSKAPKHLIPAMGLARTAAILQGFDSFMTSLMGFERDEWGRRYKMTVDTDEGPKEIVFTWSMPANMFLKYYYRHKAAMKPEVESYVKRMFETNIWEIHPIFRTGYQIFITNDNGRGDPIVNSWDNDSTKAAKRSWYATKSIIQLLGTMDKELSNKEAMDRFAKETSKTFELITRPFSVKYMRNIPERRKGWKIRTLNKRFLKELFERARKGDFMSDEERQNYQEDLYQIIEEK